MTNPTIPENGLDVSELKPCPVCGAQPKEHQFEQYAEVVCYHRFGDPDDDIGGVWITARCDTIEQARAAWNRRLPPADNAVAVKRLIWEAQRVDKTFWIGVAPLSGEYRVKHIEDAWELVRGIINIGTYLTADEAKTAAQADYETRIRSALEPTPSYAEGRAAGLSEAARLARNFDGPGRILAPGNDADLPKGWAGCRRTIADAIETLIGAAP